MDDHLFNIVIEPEVGSNDKLMRTFQETLKSCLDSYVRSERPFFIIYRPQGRALDGIEEALGIHLKDKHDVLLVVDFDERIDKGNILPPELQNCIKETFTISAPRGNLDWGEKKNTLALDELCDCLKAEFGLKINAKQKGRIQNRRETTYLKWLQLWREWQRFTLLMLNCFVSGWHSTTSLILYFFVMIWHRVALIMNYIRKSLTALLAGLVLIICYCWYFLPQLPRIAAEILVKIKRFVCG